jgi:hypothetical protein
VCTALPSTRAPQAARDKLCPQCNKGFTRGSSVYDKHVAGCSGPPAAKVKPSAGKRGGAEAVSAKGGSGKKVRSPFPAVIFFSARALACQMQANRVHKCRNFPLLTVPLLTVLLVSPPQPRVGAHAARDAAVESGPEQPGRSGAPLTWENMMGSGGLFDGSHAAPVLDLLKRELFHCAIADLSLLTGADLVKLLVRHDVRTLFILVCSAPLFNSLTLLILTGSS